MICLKFLGMASFHSFWHIWLTEANLYTRVSLPIQHQNNSKFTADHSHVFWKCLTIQSFWEMVHDLLQKILGYEIPRESKVLYLGDYEGGKVEEEDRMNNGLNL